MQQGFYDVDGLRLRYLEWGSAGSPPIVLMHGFSSTAATCPGDLTRMVIEDSAPIPPGRAPREVRNSFASRAEVEESVRASVVNMSEAALQQRVDLYYRELPDGTWAYRADVLGVRRGR